MVLLKEVIFLREIDGFSNVEYLTVLYAIVYGFIISMYFSGWGDMIRSRKHLSFDIEHLLWTIFTFTMFVFNWYGTWHRIEFINVGLGYFFYSLAPPLLFYLMSVILFPHISIKENLDFKIYLAENKKWIFGILALYFIVSITSGLVYQENDLIDKQNIFRGVGFLLCVTAALVKSRVVHLGFLVLGFGMLISFFATVPTVKKDGFDEEPLKDKKEVEIRTEE